MRIKIKILNWYILFTVLNTDEKYADFWGFHILKPWKYYGRNEAFTKNICKFYPLADSLHKDSIGNCIKQNFGIDSLENYYWYSSTASTFNDIADCNPELISVANIKKIYKRYEKEAVKDKVEVLDFSNFKRMLINEQLKVHNNNLGITCFGQTKNINNHLMWAHYADEHKGICIKFKAPKLFSERILFPVFYVNRKPKIDIDHIVHFLPLIKSKSWKYEKEVRLISFKIGENRKIRYDQSQVLEIYFGARFKKNSNYHKILGVINKSYPKAMLYQMCLTDKNIRIKPKQTSICDNNNQLHLK